MKTRILTGLFILSLALNAGVIGTFGYHWLHRNAWPHDDSRFRKHMQKTLGLSDEQATAFEKDHTELEASIAPIKSALQSKRMELVSLLDTETSYSPAMDDHIQRIANLQAEIEKNIIQHSFKAKAILTAEQQKRFNARLRKGMQREHPRPCPTPD